MPNERSRRAAAALLIAAPAALAFGYVALFGVNVPFWDEWDFIPYYDLLYSHRLRLADLFAPHNEHRIFFPRLIMLGLGNAFDGNFVSWMYASVALLCAAGAALLVQHRRLGASLFTFVPIAWLVLSLRQAQNILWGFQIQIVLCVCALVVGTALLREGGYGRFFFAAACAAVASFSFASGLLAWPALLGLLAVRRARERIPWAMLAGWIALGCAAWLLYLHGFERPAQKIPASYPLRHPFSALYVALGTMGGCISADVRGAAAAGGALLLLLGLMVFAALRRSLDWEKAAPAVPLLIFTLGAAAMVAMGRAGFNLLGVVNASRYTTMTLMGAIGLYQCLLALTDGRLRLLAAGGFAALFVLSLFGALDGALDHGAEYRAARRRDAAMIRDLSRYPDSELGRLSLHPAQVRERAGMLARYRLSLFAE